MFSRISEANCGGNGIGGVVWLWRFCQFESEFNHLLDHFFIRVSGAANGRFNLGRSVFGDVNVLFAEFLDHYAAGLGDADGGFDIFLEKYFFDGGVERLPFLDEGVKVFGDLLEARGGGKVFAGRNATVIE